MLVETLHFDGCPNHNATSELVERVSGELALSPEIRQVEVPDPETAERLRFLGSPTVRVDGNDIEPGADARDQFTSWAFTERARQSGLVPSMGSIGDCYDNAMIEAFWSRMQVELLNTRRWRTRLELANAIFEYIENFHNRRRRHSSLGMRTPIEYELLNTTPVAA
jgi:transposase InsO family protein